MKRWCILAAVLLGAAGLRAAELLPIEAQVAEAVKSPQVTVVHFWATWCPNCKAELAHNGWSNFVNTNPDVNFVFISARDEKPPGPALESYGLGAQKNLTILQHPNTSRKKDTQIRSFLGMPMTWVPTTWIFRDGELRFALNYGEIHFAMLQQLVRDSSDKWSHAKTPAEVTADKTQ